MEALRGDKFERDFGREGLSEQDAEKLGHLVQGLHRLDTGLVGKRADKIKALVEANVEKCGITAKDLEGIWNSRGGYAEVEFVTHVTHGGSVKFLPAV